MRFDTLEKRINGLESAACAGKIRTTGDDGREVWLEGSCLPFIRRVMAVGKALNRDPRLEDLPDDLQHDARLWSRAELSQCGLSDMLKGVLSNLEAKI
jgi:hypothetical protein